MFIYFKKENIDFREFVVLLLSWKIPRNMTSSTALKKKTKLYVVFFLLLYIIIGKKQLNALSK
jgi:hypothetical protein